MFGDLFNTVKNQFTLTNIRIFLDNHMVMLFNGHMTDKQTQKTQI